MPFLGKQPTTGFSSIAKDDFTADGSTTAFTLSRPAASANDVAVFVGNVRQEPTDAYSVSGTTLTLTAAPASGLNFYALHLGTVESTTVPAAGTTVPGSFGVDGDLTVDTTTLVVDSTNNNVGIGTSSPSIFSGYTALSINNATNGGLLELQNSGTTYGQIFTDGSTFNIRSSASSSALVFDTNGGNERMRIDSSGNLLLGKTTSDGNVTAGHEFRPAGYSYHAADSSAVGIFNRFTNDGDVLTIRKDSANTGRIGVEGGDLTIESTQANHAGLRFAGGSVLPRYNGSLADNAVDLGQVSTNYRFKDLYLSGGVYVGGTGSANKLDDYEEGTWTPAIAGSTGTSGVTYTRQAGKYVKMGNLVFVSFDLVVSNSGTTSGQARITGLPFATPDEFANRAGSGVGYYNGTPSSLVDIGFYVEKNGGFVTITGNTSASTTKTSLTTSQVFANNLQIISGFCYQIH